MARDILESTLPTKHRQPRYSELLVLHEISRVIIDSTDLEPVLETILDKIFASGKFDLGVIRLLDEEGKFLKPVASRGFRDPSSLRSINIDLRRSFLGRAQLKVIKSAGAYVVEDISLLPSFRRFKSEGMTSIAVVPVRAEKKVWGTIQLGSRVARKFSLEEIHLLEVIGNQLGLALQKFRLHEATRENLERLRALHAIDVGISSTLNLARTVNSLADKIDLFLPYAAVMIRLVDDLTGRLELVACRNIDEEETRAVFTKVNDDPGEAKLRKGLTVNVRDALTDPRPYSREFLLEHHLQSFLSVPLIANHQFLGALSVFSREQRDFDAAETDFLSTLAAQAAIAIHNAQLYERVKFQASELQRASKVKDEFLSVISHELKTPMIIVMGYIDLMKNGLLGEVNSEQERALKVVADHMAELHTSVVDILEITQVEAGNVRLQIGAVDPVSLMNELKSAYPPPPYKTLTIRWEYPSTLPALRTDAKKLRRVLDNLIQNGIKFTEQGEVSVTARLVEAPGETLLRGGTAATAIEFVVADTGIGIRKEDLQNIFGLFQQVDSSNTREYAGMGLGLYLVLRYTDLLGGKISIDSEPGKGSTFSLTIPLSLDDVALPYPEISISQTHRVPPPSLKPSTPN